MDAHTAESLPGQADIFSPEQEQIIHALADDQYFWRSRKRLLEVTGLEPGTLDASLAKLVHEDIVKPAFGKQNIVFGLRERVDKK